MSVSRADSVHRYITDGNIVLMMNKLYKWVITFSHFSRVQHEIVPKQRTDHIRCNFVKSVPLYGVLSTCDEQ